MTKKLAKDQFSQLGYDIASRWPVRPFSFRYAFSGVLGMSQAITEVVGGNVKSEYEEWIHDWLANHNALESGGYSRCREASEDMVKDFPSLTVVRGHVYCPHPWGKRGHWWCKEADGTIVDPTAAQFPVIFRYESYVEGDDVLLGRCMNCGDEIWGPNPEAVFSTYICGPECRRALEIYLGKPARAHTESCGDPKCSVCQSDEDLGDPDDNPS